MMNRNALSIVLLGLCILLFAAGCRKMPPSAAGSVSVSEWLEQDPDSCLSYFSGKYPSLMRNQQYAEMEQLYAGILRAMPRHPKGGKDFGNRVGEIMLYYYNALMKQGKLDGSHRLTDSLLTSHHPYYAGALRPDLLGVSALCYLSQNLVEQADSLGALFLSLPPVEDPRRDARNCYNMVWSLEFGEMDADTLVHLAERAVRSCAKAGEGMLLKGEIYSYMGYLYWRTGALEKATGYIQEAIDWYTARPQVSRGGLMEAYNNLSRVYVSLRLLDKAIEANGKAVEISKSLDNWTLEELYRMRAACFGRAARQDSALYYVQKAIEATPPSVESYYLSNLYIDRLGYYYNACPDSIPWHLEECRALLKDTAVVDLERKNNLLVYYGMALRQTPGREREAVPYLEQSYRDFLAYDYPEGILLAGDELMRTYIKAGMPQRIPDIYITYIDTADSLQRADNINAAIGANIRYETGRKEQENRALAAEVALKQRTLVFSWLLVGLLATLIITGGYYLRQRQRYLRRVSEARFSQISGLLREQKELNRNNALLARELEDTSQELEKTSGELEKKSSELEKASGELERKSGELQNVSSRLNDILKQRTVSDLRRKISTELLNSDQEAEFRRSFTAMYPDYLVSLHRCCPDLTPTDELIAMLLLLELSNSEIAITLAISMNGVKKARSRLRQRLGLKTEVVLEEFLKEMYYKEGSC